MAALLVRRLLPADEPRKQRESLDPIGVVLYGAAILLALLPLVEGGSGESLGA